MFNDAFNVIFISILIQWLFPFDSIVSSKYSSMLQRKILFWIGFSPYILMYGYIIFLHKHFNSKILELIVAISTIHLILYSIILTVISLFGFKPTSHSKRINTIISFFGECLAIGFIVYSQISNKPLEINEILLFDGTNDIIFKTALFLILYCFTFILIPMLIFNYLLLITRIIFSSKNAYKRTKTLITKIKRKIREFFNHFPIKLKINTSSIYIFLSSIGIVFCFFFLANYNLDENLYSNEYINKYYATLSVWHILFASIYIPITVNSLKKRDMSNNHNYRHYR